MIPKSLPIYIKKTILFMITIKLFKIHDAQIILDNDNNKFLIFFVHNNNTKNMCNMFTLMKRLYLPSILNSAIPKVSALCKPGKYYVKLAIM